MDASEQAPQVAELKGTSDEVIPVTFMKLNTNGKTIHVLSDQKKHVGEAEFTRTMCGLVAHRSSLYLEPLQVLPEGLCVVCAKRTRLRA